MIVIIGAGPCGLTLAYYLSKKYKILLIEREPEIGGCHAVTRKARYNNLFSEHGPRVYLDNYLNFRRLLGQMGLNFYELFTRYNFAISNVGGGMINFVNMKEFMYLGISYIKYMYNPAPTRKITMKEFMDYNNFTSEAKDYVDRLCRLTDGAGIDRYTLFEFFELLNQNILYQVYQPKLPTDYGLLKLWKEKLLSNPNIKLWLNTDVIKMDSKNNSKIEKITVSHNNQLQEIYADKFIFAIPPEPFLKILGNSSSPSIRNSFGNFDRYQRWVEYTRYFTYIPISFHWSRKLKLPSVYGFPATEWGVAFIVLTDYMKTKNPLSKTLISTCITRPRAISSKLGKTANQSNKEELLREVFRQLKESFPNLPEPDYEILSPGVYYENNEWKTMDSAYMLTPEGYWDMRSRVYKNLYNVGTQNGKSGYSFTSLESAVANGIYLVNELMPEYRQKILEPMTLNMVLLFLIIIIIILFCTFLHVRYAKA